jgi:Protease inhibitor Inh
MKMRSLVPAVVVPGFLSIALAGCGSIGAIGLSPVQRDAPEPSDAVMVSPVQSNALPPVAGAAPPPGQGGIVGAAPPGTATDTASLSQPAAPAGGALGRTDLLGGWTIVSSGDSCQLFMTLTSWTGGYRASTRGCNSEVLRSISAWNLNGTQVVLAGTAGSPVATLVSSGATRFDGQTGQGAAVSFYR